MTKLSPKQRLYFRLFKLGLVDHWTLLEVLEIPNSPPPDWAYGITQRLAAENLMGLKFHRCTWWGWLRLRLGLNCGHVLQPVVASRYAPGGKIEES